MTRLTVWLESFGSDLRYAARGLARTPGFTMVVILSLALGIGGNTAIFTLIAAIWLRPLPVENPGELQVVTQGGEEFYTNPMWEGLRDRQDVFSGVLAWGGERFNIAPGGEARYVAGGWVSGDYFRTLGVPAALGRTLTTADDRRGCAATAMLSHSFWQREYGGNPGILGKTLLIEGHPFEIIGVSRAGFSGVNVGRLVDVLVPLCSEALIRGQQSRLDLRWNHWLQVIGRPKPGISPAELKAKLAAIAPDIFAATVPPEYGAEGARQYRAHLFGLEPAVGAPTGFRMVAQATLLPLMGAVALILFIACANVANLMLARTAARQHEIAVRRTLGAGGARLIRQSVTESFLLSFVGAACGLLLAQWGDRLLLALYSTSRTSFWFDLQPDSRVLLFTGALSVATGVLFGVGPTLRSLRVAPAAAMKSKERGITEAFGRSGLSKTLVVGQVTLSMVLVASAGLMLGTIRSLIKADPGFRADSVLIANVGLRPGDPPKDVSERRAQVLARLRAIPGVRSASVSLIVPTERVLGWQSLLKAEGAATTARMNAVSDAYFETMGTPLVTGREFDDHDTASAPLVAIINETAARNLFGNLNPLGQSFRMGRSGPPREIVGIVRDATYDNLRESPSAAYLPVDQPTGGPRGVPIPSNYEIRAAGSFASIVPEIKEAIAAVNPNLTVELTPLAQRVREAMAMERAMAMQLSFFGFLALLLAAIGLYGVLSYNVTRRRHEIGIRMALGAERGRVLRMVMREAGWMVLIGLSLGIAATVPATQLVKAFLFGVQPNDPATLAVAAGLLAATAALAAYLPARRASMVDPMSALRDE